MPVDRELMFRLATSSRFERVVRGLPHGERVAWTVASWYVAGTTREDAVRQARELAQQGVSSSIDQFGELVEDSDTADRVTTDYLQLAATLPPMLPVSSGCRSTCPT